MGEGWDISTTPRWLLCPYPNSSGDNEGHQKRPIKKCKDKGNGIASGKRPVPEKAIYHSRMAYPRKKSQPGQSPACLQKTANYFLPGSGARALENPRTATGEHSLDKLHTFLSDLGFTRSKNPSNQGRGKRAIYSPASPEPSIHSTEARG
ncbi:hypothetical protein KY290_031152 [Solanum tuberosum]|uniref:DUF8018 domain-containing protein n=1 Tax=Solanum tuberosum TaxID=4113 RepID=A0ABQ7U964_SOLTU|nr:hypothetical protein KY290_031152 [Solanum tuberosum]